MKRKELQAQCLQVFQARARLKMSLVTMPEFSRTAISKAIREVRLPLREVAELSKSETWHIFANRLISVCWSKMPVNNETERVLKEYRELLNI